MLKCKSIPSTSASALQTKMSRRGKAVGWAAFDLEQRRKLGLEPQAMIESFPSVSSSISRHSKNVALLEKPFASVLQQSVNIPTLRHESNLHESQLPVCSPNACRRTTELVTEYISERSAKKALEMLKEIHPWADGGLIEDVLACTSDNVDKASTLLEEMVSSENCMENKDFETNALKSDTKESPLDGNKLSADSMKHVTIEPEWEEDDVYLIHRKDALQMMRSATRHSKTANDAYSRGDHLSAQYHSQRAQEEWTIAKRLNEKAAKEILIIRNSKNDLWTLDLHGLHAAEAVTALQEHLWKIESQVPINQLVSANSLKGKSSIMAPALSLSANYGNSEKLGMRAASSRSRATSLQVITGRGNHSRGEAALPTAIRSFLIENGYRFDETRPGLITVRPKFRRQ